MQAPRLSQPAASSGDGETWRAVLDLALEAAGGLTRVARRKHMGPLNVQRAFHPEGDDLCHLYLLHPPGGLVGGDELRISVSAGPGARALITTPASGKVYRSAGRRARQEVRLDVAAAGSLEWLPQETIVFDGADVDLSTVAHVAPEGVFLGWEVLCLGRPAIPERFTRGRCRQLLEVWRGEVPVCVERMTLRGDDACADAPWGLRGCAVVGTLVAVPVPGSMAIAALRAAANALPAGELGSVSVADDVLLARYLGQSAGTARVFFEAVWRELRPSLLGRPGVSPRIWSA